MSFVCFVIGCILLVLAALVGFTWITGDADLIRYQGLLALGAAFVALGLAVGSTPPPRR